MKLLRSIGKIFTFVAALLYSMSFGFFSFADTPTTKKVSDDKKGPVSNESETQEIRDSVEKKVEHPATAPSKKPATLSYPSLSLPTTGKGVQEWCEKAMAKAKRGVEELSKKFSDPKNLSKATFKGVVIRLDQIWSDLDEVYAPIYLLKYASPSEEVRKAAGKCLIPYFKFLSEVFTRPELYRAVSAVSRELPAYGSAELALYTKLLRSFERTGAALPPEKRKLARKLNTEMSKLGMQFSSNLSQDKTFVKLSPQEVKGVPQTILSQLKRDKEGNYLLRVRIAAHYLSFLRYAKDPKVRKKILLAYENVQAKKNIPILKKLLKLRHKFANLLGYPTFAHYILADRVAKSPDRVFKFLESLRLKLRHKMDSELKALRLLKFQEHLERGLPLKNLKIEPWDWRYYARVYKEKSFSVDSEKIREYFPIGHVIKSVFHIYQKLFNVEFKEIVPAKAWHPDVRLFAIVDKKTGNILSYFYFDLFPRLGKYSHFAAFTMRQGRLMPDGTYRKPISAIVGNWPKPIPGKPALLTHDEVETFFHEFGHIMHQTLTTAPYGMLSGTEVKRDFVEAPSQMLENWIWQKSVLKFTSKHYKTGKPLPDDMIDKLIEAKNAISGLYWTRQIFYGTIDMTYHTAGPDVDVPGLWRKIIKKVMPVAYVPNTFPAASFGHLIGYSASYYGYLWSKVYAMDMFSLFKKKGFFNTELGIRYRECILEPGGSLEPDILLRCFLRRPPRYDSFYRELGIE